MIPHIFSFWLLLLHDDGVSWDFWEGFSSVIQARRSDQRLFELDDTYWKDEYGRIVEKLFMQKHLKTLLNNYLPIRTNSHFWL